MTNEEAFEKWYYKTYPYKELTRWEHTLGSEAWQAAIAYMQEQNKSAEQSEPVGELSVDYQGFSAYERIKKLPAGYHKLYTAPQRQQPLKRLSKDDIEFVVNGWTTGDYLELANAIMDEMEKINK